MPKRVRIQFVSLRSSLVNLPISIYGPLVERGTRPQQLAIHLTLIPDAGSRRNSLEVYVGWTGMASASSLAYFNTGPSNDGALETIEIDPQYGQGLGFLQGDIVEIGLLYDLLHATTVGTEPLTSDDWEIIEIHASHVESTLLSQVRVAKIGQEIDVWVLGRTRVKLKVTSLDPPKGKALLLTTNTEISIAPKLHKMSLPVTGDSEKRSSPIIASATSTQKQTTTRAASETLRVLPARQLPHPLPDIRCPELLALVAPRTLSSLRHINDKEHPLTYFRATFEKLTSPPDPSSSAGNPISGVANEKTSSETQGKIDRSQLRLGSVHGIPPGHVVFPTLPEMLEDWDIVRITLAADGGEVDDVVAEDEAVIHHPPAFQPPTSLAGVDSILSRCLKYCVRELLLQSMENSANRFSGLLITGRSGSGRTSIVRAVAKTLEQDPRTLTYVLYIDASKLSDQPIPKIKELFDYWFDKCTWHKPATLILDNLDKLLNAEVEHADSFRSRHLTALFLRMFASNARSAPLDARGMLILATAESTASIHSSLNSGHVFREAIHILSPNKDARKEILSSLVQERLRSAASIVEPLDQPINFIELSMRTEGYSVVDLKDLVSRAIHEVAMRAVRDPSDKMELSQSDFYAAQLGFVPRSLKDIKSEKSDVAWSDIGGLEETRSVLRETLEWPTKYSPIFKQSPLRLRSGLLLYGFPGCGKTMLASAVAKECGLNFISVKGPEILNKYIGASEKSVRDLFERASAAKPCVLFFDEFDSIAPKRGHDSTGVTDRVVNQMLTQMDGAEGLDGVYVLAATSRPDLIDSALLRPGRLDKALMCDIPDCNDRENILQAVANKMSISSDVDLNEIARMTDGFSGADLQALLYNAHLDVIHTSLSAPQKVLTTIASSDELVRHITIGDAQGKKTTSRAEEAALQRRFRHIVTNSSSLANPYNMSIKPQIPAAAKEITRNHILKALKTTKPSISLEEQNRLSRIYKDFVSDRSGDLSVPPDAGGIGIRATLG